MDKAKARALLSLPTMRIALDSGLLLSNRMDDSHSFIAEIVRHLTNTFPEHQFILIGPNRHWGNLTSHSNVTYATLIATHSPLWKLSYKIKLAWLLTKYKADVIVSIGFYSPVVAKPQCILLPDLRFLDTRTKVKRPFLRFYKKHLPRFLEKANAIAVISHLLKHELINDYRIEQEKIAVIHTAGRDIFQPLAGEVTQAIKKKYTHDTEFFLCAGSIHRSETIINMLKGFSVFKKRQQSNLKLVFTDQNIMAQNALIDDLKNYKYRDDVIILESLTDDEFAKIFASAYALVYPSVSAGFHMRVLEAIKCNVPVLTSLNLSVRELINDAALYFDPDNYDDIGEKMMRIYKDENLRAQLIKKSSIIASQYSWKQTAELLWQSILKAVN